jgi:transcriptional regulator with XRE-family HTH domain
MKRHSECLPNDSQCFYQNTFKSLQIIYFNPHFIGNHLYCLARLCADNSSMAKQSPSPRRRELLTFGRRLRSWRKAKGWSQEKLALNAGLDFSYVNEIENGKLNPGLITVIALSRALEISPATLFLPLGEAQKLQSSPVVQREVQEDRILQHLEQPELLNAHCQLVVQYARKGHWEGAQQWLKALKAWFPGHWRLAYTAARYHCLKAETYLQAHPTAQIAETSIPYAAQTPEVLQELQTALEALQDQEMLILQRHCAEAWQSLFL